MASCSASGPGSTWQKFSARTNSSSSSHFCRSTTCRCISPIWPTGPPKASQPSLRKYQKRSEEHTSELQSQSNLVCRLLLEKKNNLPHRYNGYLSPCHAAASLSRLRPPLRLLVDDAADHVDP